MYIKMRKKYLLKRILKRIRNNSCCKKEEKNSWFPFQNDPIDDTQKQNPICKLWKKSKDKKYLKNELHPPTEETVFHHL